MTTPDEMTPPIVCTLDAGELAERSLEWGDLSALSISAEAIPNGVASTYPLELRAAIADLADRENDCCGSWLQSTTGLVPGSDLVRLELTTTNPDGLPIIRAMSGLNQS